MDLHVTLKLISCKNIETYVQHMLFHMSDKSSQSLKYPYTWTYAKTDSLMHECNDFLLVISICIAYTHGTVYT